MQVQPHSRERNQAKEEARNGARYARQQLCILSVTAVRLRDLTLWGGGVAKQSFTSKLLQMW